MLFKNHQAGEGRAGALRGIAELSDGNPNPILRISRDGTILGLQRVQGNYYGRPALAEVIAPLLAKGRWDETG